MSRERGLRALNLERTDRVPHTEYVSHNRLVERVTGRKPEEDPGAYREFMRLWDFDMVWSTRDPPLEGRHTSMGHAVYADGGTDFNPNVYCPFETEEDVLRFDAVKEYGVPDFNELVKLHRQEYTKAREATPFVIYPGGHYKTVVSFCIWAFGWEMFLRAVGTDPKGFGKVLDSMMEINKVTFKAWAEVDIDFFICHDDMVWTQGAIFHPDWYREQVFPRYRILWEPLLEKGIKIVFCSDGNFTEFVDDIAECGASGFIFEPLTDLEYITSRYGKTHIIVGNVDCRILTYGTREKIRAEVERCMQIGKPLPGYFIAVGNHIPHTVPVENALYYFDLIMELGRR